MTPQSEGGVADIVRGAARQEQPLEIVGHGSKRGLGRHGPSPEVLDTSGLAGIVTYEPEELVLIARAGTPLATVEAMLAAHGQTLAFGPADWGPLYGVPAGRATLGGTVAADACGSRRVFGGGVRDSLIGCRFVNGEGKIIRAGSRVMKNVTGFDLPKLMCGAMGTLGVLTELTFRLAPRSAHAAAFVIKGLSTIDGLAALRRAAQLPIEASGLAYLPKAALGLSATAHATGLAQARSATAIRVEGAAEIVADKLAHLERSLPRRDVAVLEGDAAHALFGEIGDGALFAGGGDVWRLCLPPSDATAAIESANAPLWVADWAGGALWLQLPATTPTAVGLRAITARFGGHATLMRAPAEARTRIFVFEPEAPARAHLTAGVKAAFDPHHVLNCGRMYADV